MNIKIVFLVGIVLSLSSCQWLMNPQPYPPPYSVTIGSRITIHQDLPIDANEVTVVLQEGKVINRRNLKVRQPSCRFEVLTIKATPQTLYKDVTEIIRFVHYTEYVSTGLIQFASLDGALANAASPTAEIYITEIYLRSQKQPDLFRLVCSHWEDPTHGDYLTMDSMSRALGTLASFTTK